ncbi:MAG: leucine-rich repeat domain-containing protein [Sodaliphilus sp.]|nr:leucine-rich repeat domain-containing protein [Bacteroidales bacterium]MDY3135240.1 leucine-rich repeat domain-containing protein [Sodaliphilus sp.]HAO63688.1 hypothetical protein [Porphyromonadaceae bacterium]MCI6657629.1 leucine-rich repeat domain-containing protein [Bacteroidales bacterium]MCI6901822.1 leucine-rich repeat domain-containing protein [Bacteroidales bacterium]
MKRTLLLSLALTLFTCAYAAVGDTFVLDNVTYIVKSDNTVGIKKADSKVTSFNLTDQVTNEGTTYTVVSVEDYAFQYSEATALTLPSTITSIGYSAFSSCKAASIILPKNLKTIGNYAFYAVRNITSIEIPEGVEALGTNKSSSAFGTCYALKSIKLPSTLKTIWNSTFYNCGLETVEIPEGTTFIGKNAFNHCQKLTTVTLPSTLDSIDDGVFGDCIALTTIKGAMAGVRTIGEEAFFGCPLTEFTVPAACETIGSRAFSKTKIAKFNVAAGNANFKVIDEALYTADKSLLIAFPPESATTTLAVADGCRGIQGGAFQGAKVTKVTLPSSVIALDEFAFCQSALTDITLSDNIVFFGQQAFASTNITSMTLPQGLRDLADAVFAGCEKLTSVTVGSNVKTFGIRQFYNSKALKEVRFTGSKAPTIGYWEYSSESPFYGVPTKQVTIYCPKGTSGSYTSEFGSFEAVAAIKENATGIFTPTSIVPADKAEVATLDKLTFNFAEKAIAVKSNPAIKVLCGKLVANIPMGDEVKVGMWSILGSKTNAPYAVPLDEYGESGEPINMEQGKTYFVIIPGGTFKNEAGDLNEEITLQYTGTWVEPLFMPTAVDPADGSTLKKIENVYFTFESKPTKAYNCTSKIKLIEGELVDGVPTGKEVLAPADMWNANVSGNKLQVFPADYDSFITPIPLEAGKEYFLILDAKAVYNSANVYNKQVVVKYSAEAPTGVTVPEADSYVVAKAGAIEVGVSTTANVQVFNTAGILVGNQTATGTLTFGDLSNGLYIVRIATANGKVKTVKVML